MMHIKNSVFYLDISLSLNLSVGKIVEIIERRCFQTDREMWAAVNDFSQRSMTFKRRRFFSDETNKKKTKTENSK